jgi:hypothetical protein
VDNNGLPLTNSKPNALLLLSFSVFCINEINLIPNMNRKNFGTGPTVKRRTQAEKTIQRYFYSNLKNKKMNMPTHKSKSLSAHPCKLPFAAKHMLFLPARTLR